MTPKQKELEICLVKLTKGYRKHETYANSYLYNSTDSKIIPNIPFEAELTYLDYYQGRIALGVEWEDKKTKTIYCSSMGLLSGAIKSNELKNGKIKGQFCFYKQGTSILLQRYKEE